MEEQEQKMPNGMNKNIITIVGIAIVLVGGYFLFFRSTSQSTSSISGSPSQQPITQPSTGSNSQVPAAPTASAENTVIYTDAGYAPAILQVKAGVTVVFKNQSSQVMWTASAIHPTHQAYPTTGGCLGSTFDACRGIQPGDSWLFKFDIVGMWKYHNHLSPGDTGTIEVQ
jgi:plastocyanin